jgi:hypothetical protein
VADPDGRSTEEADGYLTALASVERATATEDYGGPAGLLHRLCRAAAEALSMIGACIRLFTNGASGVTVTDGGAPHVGSIEFDVGEGPGRTAHLLCRPVLVANLAGVVGNEWPGYQHAALEKGVAAVFAFPLQLGAVAFGTFELYSDRLGPLSDKDAGSAHRFAEIALEILLDGHLTESDGTLSAGLQRASIDRAFIAQAQGMVMVDLDVTLVEAITRMRAHAFANSMTLNDLARRVISGYQLDPGDGPVATEPP